ncbi:MAG: T9SS type A sorting domain-containing protein [Bacteroidales bacterium]
MMPGRRAVLPLLLISSLLLFCEVLTVSAKDYTITATAGPGGVITPSGKVRVKSGNSISFSITANTGFEISNVVVDGKSQGAISTYTFTNVRTNHTISATFASRKYTVTASAGEGGEISPTGEITAVSGSDLTFAIRANEGYEVLNVRVDDESQGAITTYTFTNILSDHSIHATFQRVVRILGVNIPNASMKIGDVISATLTVSSDVGVSYTLISGSVGGYPLEGLHRISATSYQANFTITEGGKSFTASQEIPVSNLVISDGERMSPAYNIPIIQNSDPIDAQAPVISRMEVPSLAVGTGGTVRLTITADGTGYTATTGTVMNGIPLGSSRLTFTRLADGLYELTFVVETGDNNVAPGELEATIVMKDQAGNVGNTYQIIEPNTLEIYTALPEATLVGPTQICEGDEIQLSVHLRGRSPWSFDLYDGNSTLAFTNIALADYRITVAPVQSTTYRISSVRDVNGVENLNNGEFMVTVNEITDVEILNLAAGYDVEAGPVKLEANVPGGIFSGPGVISATGYFYPGIADTLDSPHTIYYTYTNDNGCTSTDSALVYVLGDQGAILIPGRVVCENDDPFEIAVLNVPVANGSFRLLNSASQPVIGLTDHGDNTATIEPDSLLAGSYTIEYQYFDLINLYLTGGFSVESVEQPQILNLYDTSYCQNETPFKLLSNLPNVIFEGQGVSGDKYEGFTFNPSEIDPGNIWITCTAESENGCKASHRESIFIKFAPEVMFGVTSSCMPEGGELVTFNNQTNEKLSVETWSWNFGDPGSGANNLSNLADPIHHYQEPGLKSILLKATSLDGCTASYRLDALIDSKPVTDFGWISDCFTTESAVRFVNKTSIGSATVDTVIWTFKTGDGTILDEIGFTSVTDTVDYRFSSPDNFLVSLYSRNMGGCNSELTREIILRPTIQLESDGYQESFDETEGLWTVRSDDQLESWVWGVPDFNGFTQEPGDKAWFTQPPLGASGYKETSWIQSPCFDFRKIDRPMIRMEIMRSFFPYVDGAVLQYRDAIDQGWITIGEDTPGKEWYNIENIINRPGGSSVGWGLEEFTPDTEWVTALHDLDQVAGKPNVDLRVVISTNGQMDIGNQGFAVNNLAITERSKLSILEYFTNSSDHTSRLADDIIDAVAGSDSKNVIDLQYHMAYPGLDMMNENNPDPSSTRSFNFGVTQVPYGVLDGGVSANHRYNFSDLESNTLRDHIRQNSLETPSFEIDLAVIWMITGLEASTTVTCLADRFNENVQLYLVVFETSVTSYSGVNGDTHFRNVVLDILPTPAGKLLGENWSKGNSDIRINTWDYKPYVEDLNDLAVAAFLQDRSNGRILQAAVNYKDKTVGLPDRASPWGNLNLYPNPASQIIYVNLGDMTGNPGIIELMEMNGRVVVSEYLPAGQQIFQLDIEHLQPGMYILRWIESGELRGVSKFVKMQ